MKNNAFDNLNLSPKYGVLKRNAFVANKRELVLQVHFASEIELWDKFQVNKSIIFMKIHCFDRLLKHSARLAKGRELMLGVHFSALIFENRPV